MRLQSTLSEKIKQEEIVKAKLQIGVVTNYNPRSRTVDLEAVEGGTKFIYSNVLLPSFGTGIRPHIANEMHVVFGFIGDNREFPVVMSFLTGNGVGPTEASDVSILGRVGRLYVGQSI